MNQPLRRAEARVVAHRALANVAVRAMRDEARDLYGHPHFSTTIQVVEAGGITMDDGTTATLWGTDQVGIIVTFTEEPTP